MVRIVRCAVRGCGLTSHADEDGSDVRVCELVALLRLRVEQVIGPVGGGLLHGGQLGVETYL